MPAKDTQREQERLAARPGRFRAAWAALLGHPVVPAQIRAEWAETQLVLHDMLTQLSASLARQARAEKKRIEDLHRSQAPESPASVVPPRSADPKAALRSRAYGLINPGARAQPPQLQLDVVQEEAG